MHIFALKRLYNITDLLYILGMVKLEKVIYF